MPNPSVTAEIVPAWNQAMTKRLNIELNEHNDKLLNDTILTAIRYNISVDTVMAMVVKWGVALTHRRLHDTVERFQRQLGKETFDMQKVAAKIQAEQEKIKAEKNIEVQ